MCWYIARYYAKHTTWTGSVKHICALGWGEVGETDEILLVSQAVLVLFVTLLIDPEM